jgi:fructose-1-phosphate kinase PfkB-like protein
MTKLITVTGRAGAGKTTVAAILAEKLSENHTICLIDNNRSNINIYSAISPITNINLYSCLADKESCSRAIKESAAELKKNMYFFSGGNELLTEEEIQILKEHDIFEYIVLDTEIAISNELLNYNIAVINPNKYEYENAIKSNTEKNIIIVNRYVETELKVRKNDFKLYFCPEIINFTSGYELRLPEIDEKEVGKIIDRR